MRENIQTILVTGGGGLLGSEFREISLKTGSGAKKIITLKHQELDITDPYQVDRAFGEIRPSYLINCAAYTNVDKAEVEAEKAEKINVAGAKILAQACEKSRVKLIHFSTHFVFDGKKTTPYLESDPVEPLNVYGRTKLEGERIIQSLLPPDRHLILRVSWLYGKNGNNFIHSLWNASKDVSSVRVVDDQVAAPNPAPLLAKRTLDLLETGEGLFHFSCSGSCSRYELIRFLFSELKLSCKVIPISSGEFASLAKRPAFSAMGSERTELLKAADLPLWQDALRNYLAETR